MICRTWHGWSTPANADAYESIVRGEVIPGIEAMRIPGFRHIDLLRRELEDEVEFMTVMWFDDIESIQAFVGEDHEVSHVPPAARAVLLRFDDRSAHYTVLERRTQDRSDASWTPAGHIEGSPLGESQSSQHGRDTDGLALRPSAVADPSPGPETHVPGPAGNTPG